jgi:hypothetical protein
MKLGPFILIGALCLLGIGYTGSQWFAKSRTSESCDACAVAPQKTADALAWMRGEFSLSDEEFAKVCSLHDEYLPHCDEMCRRMAAANERLAHALEGGLTMTGEAQAALREYDQAEADCRHQTLQHVLRTAAVMKPEAGRAFVQQVLPHLLVSRRHVSDLQHSPADHDGH